MDFAGKKVLVGVSGGIAAYKAAEVVRLFVKAGAAVNVVMTKHATEFITPLTMQTLCGNPVLTDLFDLQSGAEIKHVSLADEADVVVLVPATANLIGKLANAIADDLLTSMLLVTRCPVVIAPAMNVSMWEHPIVAQNLNRLREVLGYQVVEPAEGLLACGYEGKGKLADPEEIVKQASVALSTSKSSPRSTRSQAPQDLAGKKILITAGPTREYLDPVRYLSNPSTGKMGIAVAEAAAARGAEVTLVLGPTHLKPSGKVKTVNVETADEMYAAASEAYAGADVFIASAAVADYKPAKRESQKVKKRPADEPLTLVRTPDILLELSKNKGKRVLVGFAAETTNVVEHAREKLTKKNCDLIVANDVTEQGSGFGTDTNRVMLVTADNVESLPVLHKREVADRILDRVLRLL
jgi:phosphopantothenoylcysteine decarboxylase/phosphopantothenate--cysteine ligase